MPFAADLWRRGGRASLFQSWEGPGIIHHGVGQGAVPVAWRDGFETAAEQELPSFRTVIDPDCSQPTPKQRLS